MSKVETPRVKEYDRLIRKLRRDPRLWDADNRVSKILGKALARRAKLSQVREQTGPYSGLTRSELRKSGTCETDWY